MNKVWFFITLVFACGFGYRADAQLPVPIPQVNPVAGSAPAPASVPPGGAPAAAPQPQPGLLNGYVSDDSYQLRVGDTISFQIMEDRVLGIQEVPLNLVVADSGEVQVPYIGRVMAVGSTCKQLAEEIKSELDKNYYKNATVVVALNVANRILGRVYIWGQVRSQGALDLQVNEDLTAGKAILRAGGFADFANKRKVKVVRTRADGKSQTFELDMEKILEQGKIDQDIVLKPNDLVIVPSRLVNF